MKSRKLTKVEKSFSQVKEDQGHPALIREEKEWIGIVDIEEILILFVEVEFLLFRVKYTLSTPYKSGVYLLNNLPVNLTEKDLIEIGFEEIGSL